MMYSIDGKFGEIEGRFLERKIKSLTYKVNGSWFPMSYQDNTNSGSQRNDEILVFQSTKPNSITINYGDGTVVNKQFEYVSANIYKVAYTSLPADAGANWRIPRHTYTDGKSGSRFITFEFEKPEYLYHIVAAWTRFIGSLPLEMKYFEGMTFLRYLRGGYVDVIPDSFPPKLDHYTISNTVANTQFKIPDAVFETKLSTLNITGAYDLSDNIASNFFKINQLKETLTNLSVDNSNIKKLPDDLKECTKITTLEASSNNYTSIPSEVNSLVNLGRLHVGNIAGNALTDTSIPVWTNLQKLTVLSFSFKDANLSDIPNSWKYLYSLSTILTFNAFITSNAKLDEFIPYFYTLCTENGSIVAGGSATPYPNRFRNITWGHSTLSFTGAKVAPTGYVQGVSNGTPTTNGERVYVLQNQYNHTIAHGTPTS